MWEAPLLNHGPRPLALLFQARCGFKPSSRNFLSRVFGFFHSGPGPTGAPAGFCFLAPVHGPVLRCLISVRPFVPDRPGLLWPRLTSAMPSLDLVAFVVALGDNIADLPG